jgi:hypothetical protein
MVMQVATEITNRRREHDRAIQGLANRDRKALKATLSGDLFALTVRGPKAANKLRLR